MEYHYIKFIVNETYVCLVFAISECTKCQKCYKKEPNIACLKKWPQFVCD